MKTIFYFLIIIMVNISIAYAQVGYSSASLSMNRANGVVSSDQVLIDEYVNYHTHQIPRPAINSDIALSSTFYKLDKNEMIYQVGISTNQVMDFSNIPPINICLVIDCSGSMQYDSKIEKVKKALLKFIKGLRPDDMLSIVTYETSAKVLLTPQKIKHISNMDLIIKSLIAEGSTNLEGGLTLGYKQVLKNMKKNYNNKVILLTDGIANVGVTSTEKIVEQSGYYNKKGVDVSTIGVGLDLNYKLLQQIANRGNGANHFIGSNQEDFDKVFENELESLLSPIAKNVFLHIEYPDSYEIDNIYGYQPQFGNNYIDIPLKNINSALTQIILVKFKIKNINEIPIKASLRYFSFNDKENKELKTEIYLNESKHSGLYGIKKNYTIACLAEDLKTAASKIEEKNIKEGIVILDNTMSNLNKEYPYLKDKDINRVKEIIEKNLNAMKKYEKKMSNH